MRRFLILVAAALAALAGCGRNTVAEQYADSAFWYTRGGEAAADVFYIVSTNVVGSFDMDGNESYLALLTDEERATMDKEFAYVANAFGDSLNFYAPYYHQYTLNSITLSKDEFMPLRGVASDEVCEAFDYYIEHFNEGRPFVLAGFSQGAMHVIDVLKHMSDEQYARCVAAYSIGYRLSEEDLAEPHVKAALGETDLGVTVSFNSVSDTSAIWPAISEGAATCMNPVNWCTDSTPAPLFIDGCSTTVSVNPEYNVLVVDGVDAEKYFISSLSSYCKIGNLHLGDLLFYSDLIGRNARKRAFVYEK